MCSEITVNSLGNPCTVNPEEEKGRVAVGRICRKGSIFKAWNERVGDGIPNNSEYDCWQIRTV